MRQRDVNQECEYCHDDLSKRLCVWCRDETRVKLEYLARNLAVAGALCKAFEDGGDAAHWDGRFDWHPGCGRPCKEAE